MSGKKGKKGNKSLSKMFDSIKKDGRKTLTVEESLKVLETYGVPVVEYETAKTAEDAVDASEKIGYPVVMKVISKKATHKTDVGGVAIGLQTDKEVEDAFSKMKNKVKKASADFDGVLIQPMVGSDSYAQEIIVGGKKDPQFGQTIAFGLGGIFVEVFEDIAFRVVPIEREDARDMMEETKGYKLLSGHRGKMYDVGAVENILMKVSKLLDENDAIAELDVNPVMVLMKGALAVDGRIILE